MSSTSGIISSSCHQFGVSTSCPLHSTHFSYSTGGSAGKWPPASSSHLPASPWKNHFTSGPNSGGDPRSNSASSSSHPAGLCAGVWALWHLLLCPQDLLLHWSQLWEGAWVPEHCLMMDQLNHSIFSSKVMVVVRAFWWASLTSASWISAEVPPLSPCGILLCIRCAFPEMPYPPPLMFHLKMWLHPLEGPSRSPPHPRCHMRNGQGWRPTKPIPQLREGVTSLSAGCCSGTSPTSLLGNEMKAPPPELQGKESSTPKGRRVIASRAGQMRLTLT